MVKTYSSLAVLLLLALASCAPNDTTPATPTFLVTNDNPATITLGDPAKDTETTLAHLTCGCGFTLSVTPLRGDTNWIHFQDMDAATSTPGHSLSFFGVSGAPKGSDTAYFALAAGPAPFYDTEQVILTVP